MESGVVTVLYFFAKKEEGIPSSHFMTFGTPSGHVTILIFIFLYPAMPCRPEHFLCKQCIRTSVQLHIYITDIPVSAADYSLNLNLLNISLKMAA